MFTYAWLLLSENFCLLQVTKGNDVVITIEKAKTDRNDKPFEDIKIVNIDVEKTS